MTNELESSVKKVRWGPLIILLVAAALLLAVLRPVYTTVTESSRQTNCLSNVKQLGTRMIQYLADHDDRFPPTSWKKPLQPYEASEREECPSVVQAGKHFGYAMNSHALGRAANKLRDPAQFVVFFETDALGEDVVANLRASSKDRHQGSYGRGSNAAHADGSAKFYVGGPGAYDE